MAEKKVQLDAMLHKERDGTFAMYFCRGKGKCTKTLAERKKLSRKKRVCEDCVKGDESETLEHLMLRVNRGDA
jgi:hypothetical protein